MTNDIIIEISMYGVLEAALAIDALPKTATVAETLEAFDRYNYEARSLAIMLEKHCDCRLISVDPDIEMMTVTIKLSDGREYEKQF